MISASFIVACLFVFVVSALVARGKGSNPEMRGAAALGVSLMMTLLFGCTVMFLLKW